MGCFFIKQDLRFGLVWFGPVRLFRVYEFIVLLIDILNSILFRLVKVCTKSDVLNIYFCLINFPNVHVVICTNKDMYLTTILIQDFA